MGFQPWVPQQDTNTEIRVALLLSLTLQIALIFLGPMRKRSYFPRSIIWSCYLLADWVADLALGLLLNNLGGSGGSPIIFAFWTPFLLLHLGGPDTITAYSVEDNELWLRHLIGLLFEIFSAAVIFICSLHSNPMIGATVLVFVAGIIKYGERTFSLYSGSIERFRANILGPGNPGSNYARLMTEFESKQKAGLVVEICAANGENSKAQQDAERLDTECWLSSSFFNRLEAQAYEFFLIFRRLFVDLVLNSKQRRMTRALFLEHRDMNPRIAFDIVESELDFIYDMVYTKAPVAYTRAGWVLRSICSGCIFSAAVIFFLHDKRGIQPVDVRITYALLLGGLALDMIALTMLLFSSRASVFFQKSLWFDWLERLTSRVTGTSGRRCWSQSAPQFSLIMYALGRPYSYKARFLLTVAKMLHCEEALEDLIFVEHESLWKYTSEGEKVSVAYEDEGPWAPNPNILRMAFDSVKTAAQEFGDKHEEVEEAFNCRGSRVIRSFEALIKGSMLSMSTEEKREKHFDLIMGSVMNIRDFDESLLLWHITTDLMCLLPLEDRQGPMIKSVAIMLPVTMMLSRYMMYLLIKQPQMLSARTGVWLMRYQDTCAEARRFFRSMDEWIEDPDDAIKALLGVNTSEPPERVKGYENSKSVLFDACVLVKALRKIEHEELLWEVVCGVWLEMLLYAARKCPGSTHVRQLNRGGELITLIWLLIQHMGLGENYDVTEARGTMAKLLIHDQ